MSKYLTEEQFTLMMEKRTEGKASLSISGTVARQFFTRVRSHTVSKSIGQSIRLKKLVIWTCIIASPLMFLLFTIVVVFHFGPQSASLAIPAAGICWTIVYGLTSEQGGWRAGTIPLLLSIGLTFTIESAYAEPLLLFIFSLWLQRTTYLLSSNWLEKIVAGSYIAYEELADHIDLLSTE